MSNIIRRCTELTRRIGTLRSREAVQDEAEQLERRRSELEIVREQLESAVQSAKVLSLSGRLGGPAIWPDVATARGLSQRVRERLREDPGRIAAGREYRALLDRIALDAETLEQKVAATWSEVRLTEGAADEALLERAAQVPGQAAAVDRVRRLQAELDDLGAQPPTTLESYGAFVRKAALLRQARGGLNSDLPEAVSRFLDAAQSPAGAGLALWTDEVRGWLEKHDMLNGVRLRFSKGRA